MTWTVYLHTERSTGRHYVGITSSSMEARWAQHVRASRRLKGRSRFHRELARLGPEAFDHRVLAEGLTRAEAERREGLEIVRHDAIRSGFNTRPEAFRLDDLLE